MPEFKHIPPFESNKKASYEKASDSYYEQELPNELEPIQDAAITRISEAGVDLSGLDEQIPNSLG